MKRVQNWHVRKALFNGYILTVQKESGNGKNKLNKKFNLQAAVTYSLANSLNVFKLILVGNFCLKF